jgi:8-oxo-dGTP pyrophosphatase MutT (NUDIX family)
MASGDELVDVVDEQDRVTGVATRREAVRRGLLHRIVYIACRDDQGRYLVHQRPAGAPWFAGMYAPVIGGAVHAGEAYQAAAARETLEETGLNAHPQFQARFLCHGAHGTYWAAVFEARLPRGPITPPAGEFAWTGRLTLSQVEQAAARLPFVAEAQEAFSRYLAAKDDPTRGRT